MIPLTERQRVQGSGLLGIGTLARYANVVRWVGLGSPR